MSESLTKVADETALKVPKTSSRKKLASATKSEPSLEKNNPNIIIPEISISQHTRATDP